MEKVEKARIDPQEKYEALKLRHDDMMLRNRKKEMELLAQAYRELGYEVEGVVTPYIDAQGMEVLDPRPLAPPVGFVASPPIHERLRELIAGERMRRIAELEEMETFEEADDFEISDDPIPMRDTPYENEFDPPIRELVAEGNRVLAEKQKSKKPKKPEKVESDPPAEDPPEE